jgi:hypothetical protein
MILNCTYYEEDNGSECGKRTVGTTGLCHTHLRMLSKAEETDKRSLAKRKAAMEKPRKVYAKPKKVSDKRKVEIPIYSERRKIFLEGKKCAVFPNLEATEVHHRCGKRGFIDQWAYDNGITAFLDERYWLPVSNEGHIKIEADTVWAKDMGFSVVRSIPIRQTI